MFFCNTPRRLLHHDYDIASRLNALTYDGQSFASNIVYNAASQTTSLTVGAGTNQITENYSYNAQTGLLDNQTLVRGATTLLDLSYDYVRAGTTSGRTGQLTKILNNLNHNKDRGYSYDALGRLVQATGGVSGALWTQTYAYDRYGNRTSVSASGYSASNRGSGATKSEPPALAGGPTLVSESRQVGIATGSEKFLAPQPRDLLARNTLVHRQSGSEPISDSPPTLYAPPAQSGPPTFTDDPLVAGATPVKVLHITELRAHINSVRQQRGLLAYIWQYSVTTNDLISANPIIEMRTALDQALGPPSGGYSAGLAQGQPVLAIHIQELRNRVKDNWNSSIPTDGMASVSYDTTSNRITTAGFEYDAAGNQTRALVPGSSNTFQKFQYDAAGRLVKVKNDSGVTIASYTYGDSNERLIAQDGDESSNYRTYYVGEGGTTIAEYSETPSLSTTPQWSKSYVYLGNRLLATLTPNPGTPNTELTEYHHPDRLGTRIVTNPTTGTFFEQQTLPFGTALNDSPPAGATFGETNRRFTSYDRSGTTKLDYAVNRHYDPQQGRFTQVDPAGMKATTLNNPQTLNMYAYCANDPINRTDHDGLGLISFFKKVGKWIKKHWKIILIAVAVAVAVLLIPGAPGFLGSFFQNAGTVILGAAAEGGGIPTWLKVVLGGALAAGIAGIGILAQRIKLDFQDLRDDFYDFLDKMSQDCKDALKDFIGTLKKLAYGAPLYDVNKLGRKSASAYVGSLGGTMTLGQWFDSQRTFASAVVRVPRGGIYFRSPSIFAPIEGKYLLLHEMMHLAFPQGTDLDQSLGTRLGISRRGSETWSQAVSRYFSSKCNPKEKGP